MSLRNLRGWMNAARRQGYCGPTEGAVLLTDGTIVSVPNLANWLESHQILSGLSPEKVAATFTKAPKGGWCGEATVPGLRTTQNLYVSYTGDDFDAAVEAMISKLLEHATRLNDLRLNPEARLEALLASHDWYSAYSDAPGVALAGDSDWLRIYKLLTEVPLQVARTLFAKHAPQDFTCPV